MMDGDSGLAKTGSTPSDRNESSTSDSPNGTIVNDVQHMKFAIPVVVLLVLGAFGAGMAFGHRYAPSPVVAGVVRLDAEDRIRSQAYKAAYKTAFDREYKTSKQRAVKAGVRQGEREGARSGKAEAQRRSEGSGLTPTTALDCPSFDLNGTDYGVGAGYFDISVRGMQCQEAKNLILAAGANGNFNGLRAHGWSCGNLGSAGETTQYRCTDSRDRAFRWWFGT